MKISYTWLKQYLNLKISPEETSELLTSIGLEVENINIVENIKGGLKGIVVGEVISKEKHPNADRLSIASVDIDTKEPLQIICGAPNLEVGQKVPVATVGTILYDNEKPIKIKKGKIRGEYSFGMICSEYEIGLGSDDDGIMVIDPKAKNGINAADFFNIESDHVFEIGLTPNRSDAMSHIGVARDLMTALNHHYKDKLKLCIPIVEDLKIKNTKDKVNVKIEDNKLCPRYSGITIKNVKVSNSPLWLQNRLKSIGISPTNNIVDITNFVLHETGQPLHAFDFNKIEDKSIIVKTLKAKQDFIGLDDNTYEISSSDLMICDSKKPLCIAGLFGGKVSEIDNNTTDIFIESAYFNPISIRKSSKRHSLNTDASFRFERGCDPNMTLYALKRAALLVLEVCGGESSNIIDIYKEPIKNVSVTLTYDKLDSLIGKVIDRKIVKSILEDLDIIILEELKDRLILSVPTYRVDVTREVDVIEEIIRIFGYDNLDIPEQLKASMTFDDSSNSHRIQELISDLLSNNGFYETMNNSLTKSSYSDIIKEIDAKANIEILNPLSQDLNVMRQSLLFGGLENIAYNQNRKNSDLKLYEFGNTYHKIKNENIESQHLQILASGKIQNENWNSNTEKVDFFYMKEKVDHILNRLGIKDFTTSEGNGWGREYSTTYSVDNKRLVCFGQVTKELCDKFNIKSEVFMADFNWDLILEIETTKQSNFITIPKFPEVRRDLSLLIDKDITFDKINQITKKCNINILKSVSLFDIYEGDNLPDNKKSYSVAFTFGDPNKTLTDQRVNKIIDELIATFKKEIGAEIR